MNSTTFEQISPISDPGPVDSAVTSIYVPKSKSFYLSVILRTLAASGFRAYAKTVYGEIIHRIVESVAIELERIDRGFQDALERGIFRGVYEAFSVDFAAPRTATYATGIFEFVRSSPATSAETIAQDTIVSARDGRTAVTIAALTIPVGAMTGQVGIRSEAPGPIGNAPVGTFSTILSTLPGTYRGSNISVVDGGKNAESQLEVADRWGRYIASAGQSTEAALLSVAENASVVVGVTTYRVRDIGIIRPWRVREMARRAGTAYMLIESGGGIAPSQLVTAVQTAVDAKVGVGQEVIVASASAFIVPMQVNYKYVAGASPTTIQTDINAAWATFFDDSRIEDGTGRGTIGITNLDLILLNSNASIADLSISLTSEIQPPLEARAIPGTLTFVASVA